VIATVMEPLRNDWNATLSTASRQRAADRPQDAVKTILSFHHQLCGTRILDPACGTGNFLYVSLELLKRLEGEVLEALADLGGQEMLRGLQGHTVDPHQFLGLEINPRAVAIAELVLWIGYLQWHFRTKGGMPDEPILRAFHNIKEENAVLQADAVLARDAKGLPKTRRDADGADVEVYTYKNPRRADWPPADFIVGNPPFIGGKDLRARLGEEQAQALWRAHADMNESADFVMYWWNRAAEILTASGSVLRRFGFVTTNSITQVFQRRVTERYLSGKSPLSLVMAIPDHPWTKATSDAAAVRIAMTVAEAGTHDGLLHEVTRESGLDTDAPVIEFSTLRGRINADLTVGVDVTLTKPLLANEGVCSPGVKLHGNGFIVTPAQAAALGLGRRPGLDDHIRTYRNGRDLTSKPRGVMVIDLFGLSAEEVRQCFPEVYQHLLSTVKVDRGKQVERSPTACSQQYLRDWWFFGVPRQGLRSALAKQHRYIATVETAKHRVFQFLDADVLPDNMLVAIGSDDAYTLGVLSSRLHVVWSLAQGGTLEDRPRYSKSRCFDPFPFPDTNDLQKHRIRQIAERLDARRKRVLAEHEQLTLTGLYNVLEKLRAGTARADLAAADRRIFDDGLVGILKEDHDKLDAAVVTAYGWPADLPETEILTRLVALNKERTQEEAQGLVRWLRPDYQIPKFGTAGAKAQLDLGGGTMRPAAQPVATGPKAVFPPGDLGQTAAVMVSLVRATRPLSSYDIAANFRQGRRILPQIEAVLAAPVWDGWVSQSEGNAGFVLRKAA
jgi:restriction-modification enzyme MmeI-like protein